MRYPEQFQLAQLIERWFPAGIWPPDSQPPVSYGPEPRKAEEIWVFNLGRNDGPLRKKEFIRDLMRDRWPESAIVALDDCTTWCTIKELRSIVEGECLNHNDRPSMAAEILRDAGKKIGSGVLAAIVLGILGIDD